MAKRTNGPKSKRRKDPIHVLKVIHASKMEAIVLANRIEKLQPIKESSKERMILEFRFLQLWNEVIPKYENLLSVCREEPFSP